MTREPAVSYWLMPSRESAAPFEQAIAALTAQQGVPGFAPHLTLGTLRAASPAAGQTLGQMRKVMLEPESIDGNEGFTTSLFVRFRPSEVLGRMRAVIETNPEFRSGRLFDPHISLCYGAPPPGARQLLSVTDLLITPISFDRIVAVSVKLPITSHADLQDWHPVETVALGLD